MKVNFDTRGNLKPYEKIKLTLDEFEDFFVEGMGIKEHRKRLFDSYLEYVTDFSKG